MNEILLSLIKNSFGFDPAESRHHFVVDIPRGGDAPIKISEHLTWDDETGSSAVTSGTTQDGQIRVILARLKWDAIADEVRTQFNLRLKKLGKKSGSWRAGRTWCGAIWAKNWCCWPGRSKKPTRPLSKRLSQLERAGAGRTLVALHPDRRCHRARHQRPRARLAQSSALCPDRKPCARQCRCPAAGILPTRRWGTQLELIHRTCSE